MYGVRLAWEDLPAKVRSWVEEVLGAPVTQALSQPGGFSPGSADRVRTAEGRQAFVKAVSADQNPDTPDLHRREAAALRDLAGLEVVPSLLGAFDDGHWVALVIEDVEGQHPLPWAASGLSASLAALATLAGRTAPVTWPSLREELRQEMACWGPWLQAPPADLDPWLRAHLPELHGLAQDVWPRLDGDAVVHTDVRADNLLLDGSGRVHVVDWPWASRGVPWFDAVTLLINVRWDGGTDLRPHLPRVHDLGATDRDILGVLAGLGGFFETSCRRPAPPGLPTLRPFQAAQGRATTRLLQELWERRG